MAMKIARQVTETQGDKEDLDREPGDTGCGPDSVTSQPFHFFNYKTVNFTQQFKILKSKL